MEWGEPGISTTFINYLEERVFSEVAKQFRYRKEFQNYISKLNEWAAPFPKYHAICKPWGSESSLKTADNMTIKDHKYIVKK